MYARNTHKAKINIFFVTPLHLKTKTKPTVTAWDDWWLQCFRLGNRVCLKLPNPFFCQSPYLEEVQLYEFFEIREVVYRRQQLYITQFWPWPLKTELDASFQLKNSINPHIQDGRIGTYWAKNSPKKVQILEVTPVCRSMQWLKSTFLEKNLKATVPNGGSAE